MTLPSKKTLIKAAQRMIYVAIASAITTWVLLPINLENPKQYLYASLVALTTGFLMGLHKAISGFIKYDKDN